MAEGYSTKERYRKERQTKERAKGLAGCIKWQGGQPTLHYARDGYAWVNGRYVKVDPRGTGITQTFSNSRAQEREARHHQDHPGSGLPKREGQRKRSERSRSKQRAREQFERASAIANARLKALKADRKAARLARQAIY